MLSITLTVAYIYTHTQSIEKYMCCLFLIKKNGIVIIKRKEEEEEEEEEKTDFDILLG